MHRHFGDAKAAGECEDRHEAVHLAVQPQFTGHLGPKQLQATVVVVQVQAGQVPDHAVEHLAGIDLVPGVEPPLLPPVDDVVPFVEPLEKLRNLRRVILQVGIHRHHQVAPDSPHAGRQCRSLSEVPPESDTENPFVLFGKVLNDVPRAIGRTVVDEDDLERNFPRRAGGNDLPMQFDETFGFVQYRNDNRQQAFHAGLHSVCRWGQLSHHPVRLAGSVAVRHRPAYWNDQTWGMMETAIAHRITVSGPPNRT